MSYLNLRHKAIKPLAATFASAIDRALHGGRRPSLPKAAGTYLLFDYDTALGLVLMNSAVYEGIKRANPAAKIIVACGQLTREALSANPHVDALIDLGEPQKGIATALRRLLRWRLSKRTPLDVALINCSIEKFTADLLVIASGPAYRVGSGAIPIYDRAPEFSSERSVQENSIARLIPAGISNPIGEPRVYFNSTDLDNARRLVAETMTAEQTRIAYVTQTSGGHPNQWWDNRFAEVADAIAGLTKAPAVFLGTKADAPGIGLIRQQMKTESTSLAGRTNLRELAAVVAQCDLVVSLDTGTLHVARGTGTPAVVIAPAHHKPAHEWLPLNDVNMRVLRRHDIWCRGCQLVYCATRECMDQITPARVVDAVRGMIREKGPSRAAREGRVAVSLSNHEPAIY